MTAFQKRLLQKIDQTDGKVWERTLSGPEVRCLRHMRSMGINFTTRRFVAYHGHLIEITDAGREAIK